MSEVVGGHTEGPESSLLGLRVYACVRAKPFQSCPTLCNLMHYWCEIEIGTTIFIKI